MNSDTIFGMKVVVAKEWPKMQLSTEPTSWGGDFITPEMRKETNEWLLEFFGTTCLVDRGHMCVIENNKVVIVHPDDYAKLQQAIQQQSKER